MLPAGKTTISAWMKDGHAYGSAQLAGTAPLPFNISCDAKADVCLGTLVSETVRDLIGDIADDFNAEWQRDPGLHERQAGCALGLGDSFRKLPGRYLHWQHHCVW